MLSEIINILRVDKAFSLASKGRDKESLDLCDKTYRLLENGNLTASPSVIEAMLLRSFLAMELNDMTKVRQSSLAYLKHRRSVAYFSKSEYSYMNRYLVSVLWISRGRAENSCLISIRNKLAKDWGIIRPTTQARFRSPDA